MMMKTIGELLENCVVAGQIMSRVTADENQIESVIGSAKVVIPKCIHSDGTIETSEMATEFLKVKVEEKRMTHTGQIVLKLSTPYDAGLVTDESSECVVPSFCALITPPDCIDTNYLLAYLNSSIFKDQVRRAVSGTIMTILSVGKLRNVQIPVPSQEKQIEIGKEFIRTKEKVAVLRRIVDLELMKNDALIMEMMDNER